MSVLATDIKMLLSGGASNTDPNASLGGIVSTTEVVDDTLQNLFDNVSGTEHTAGNTEYRAVFIKNNSAETAYNAKIWIESNTTGDDSAIEIAKEASSGSPIQTVGDESTAPTGPTFSTADGIANAIVLGDMTAGTVYGIWVKRIITAGSAPQANDTAQIKVYVDSL